MPRMMSATTMKSMMRGFIGMSLMKTFLFKDCESKIYNEIKVIGESLAAIGS